MTYQCMVQMSSPDQTSSALVDLFLAHPVAGAQVLIDNNTFITYEFCYTSSAPASSCTLFKWFMVKYDTFLLMSTQN